MSKMYVFSQPFLQLGSDKTGEVMCRRLACGNFEFWAEGFGYHVNYREIVKIWGQGKDIAGCEI